MTKQCQITLQMSPGYERKFTAVMNELEGRRVRVGNATPGHPIDNSVAFVKAAISKSQELGVQGMRERGEDVPSWDDRFEEWAHSLLEVARRLTAAAERELGSVAGGRTAGETPADAPVFPSAALVASLAAPEAPEEPEAAEEAPEVVMREKRPVTICTATAPPVRFSRAAPSKPEGPVGAKGCAADAESVESGDSSVVRIWSNVEAMRLAMSVPALEARLAETSAALEDALANPPRPPSLMSRIGAWVASIALNPARQPLCV